MRDLRRADLPSVLTMRIALTVESGEGSHDLLLDCDDAATVEEVERSLHSHLGRPVRIPGSRRGPVRHALMNGARLGGPGRRRAAPRSRCQLHVVSGPDCGAVWDLAPGDHIIGRSGSIWWNDPAMSRRHVTVYVGATAVEVADLGSRHGTRIEGIPCVPGDRLSWPVGATLEVGTSVAILRERASADGRWEQVEPGWRHLLRPPRLPTEAVPPIIEMPEPPRANEMRSLPLVAVAVPLVVGIGIALALRRPEYLLFALASPSMVVANHLVARIGMSRRRAAAATAFEEDLEEAEERVAAAIRAEQHDLRERQPDAAAVLATALLPGRRLWERRRGDPDFLNLRVGCLDRPTTVVINGGERTDRVARLVPQPVDIAAASITGIVGPVDVTDGVLRWMIAQAAAHHAPRDLSLVFLDADTSEAWAWLRWLPHVSLETGAPAPARLAALQELVRGRRESCGDRPGSQDFPAIVVVVRAYAEVARVMNLRDIVEDGPSVGVYLICTADVDSELPDHAGMVLAVSAPQSTHGSLAGKGFRLGTLLLEQVSVQWATRFARALAPFRDASNETSGAVPDGVRLWDVLRTRARVGDVVTGWRSQPRSTIATLGASADGPLCVDLKTDGPHALVAGTTGSGKTQLLQMLIMSLALANHPQWLNFVLIDYKGDSAFQECARLPHAVGKVTDLNPALVERALVSLRAELERRKVFLAEAAVSDIDAYHEVGLREPHRPPLPRLVLVIDEFAELARELPDFVDGLVTIAQVGRSLGVHLVLATQRPGGVLSPAIRANTNIRIALRVADASDSVDVVGAADASSIPAGKPGRGYLRMGAAPLIEFQTARVSGVGAEPGPPPRKAPVITPLGGRDPRLDVAQPPTEELHESSLAELVERMHDAAQAEGLAPPRRPWLDPLPALLPWSRRDRDPDDGRLRFPLGLADFPDQQRQATVFFDPARDGHVFFIGAARCGRSQALRVVGAAIAESADPAEVHVYGIDCGAGELAALASMPHCGAIVGRHEAERVGRLLARIMSVLERRQASGGDDDDRASPRLVVMLDRWEGFLSAFEGVGTYVDTVMRLLREGAGVGIHLVIAGDRALLANPRMSAMTEAKYVLRLAERGDYALAGLNVRQIGADMPPGRCLGPDQREVQIFLLDVEPSYRPSGQAPRPFRLDPLPTHVGVGDALALLPSTATRPAPIVAVGGDELVAIAPDLERSSCFAVIGPARSGRSTVLMAAAESATLTGAEVVLVSPRPGSMRQVERQPGVRVADATAAHIEAVLALGRGGRLVLVVDDVDQLDPSVDDALHAAVRGSVPGAFLLVAGTAEGIGYGLRGWRAEVRRAGQGLLLSPRSPTDGELIGARLSRDVVGGPIRPGTGLLQRPGEVVMSVATPVPTPELRVTGGLRKSDVDHGSVVTGVGPSTRRRHGEAP